MRSSAKRENGRLLLQLLRALAIVVLAVVVIVLLFEKRFIFIPKQGGVGASPGEDVWLTTTDDVRIHGWYVEHPDAVASLLWFHGNAGNIESRRHLLLRLRDLPANVLIIDYRGYGKSEGSPDEPGVYRDAQAAWEWLAARAEPERIIIFGISLGGGPACELATQVDCGGLVLESIFTSAKDMSSRVIPFLPVRWLMRTHFDNLSKIAKIKAPKLLIHSRADDVVPFAMGERLFEAAASPKEHAWFDEANHNNLTMVHGDAYYDRLRVFIERAVR